MGLPEACAAALRCVPFVLPKQWLESPAQMAEELAMYSIHIDPSVCEARTPVLRYLQWYRRPLNVLQGASDTWPH